MTRHWIEKGVAILLGVVIASDGGLLLKARLLHMDIASLHRPGVPTDRGVPLEAFASTGARLDSIPQSSPGWVVRFVSAKCGYCEQDTHWQELAPELIRLGYPLIILLPNAGEEISDDRTDSRVILQAAFVSMEWIKRFRLTFTPSTLIFDSRGKLIWHREGTLKPTDVGVALRAVQRARAPEGGYEDSHGRTMD